MKIFVTGGSGFIGVWLIKKLISQGYDIVNFDLIDFPESLSKINDIRGDVRNYKQVKVASEGADIVFHLAACPSLTRGKFKEINVCGTENVLKAAMENKVKKLIYISSSSVFGIPKTMPVNELTPLRPIDKYGKSKLEAEKLCQKYMKIGMNIVILRPSVVIGPTRLGIFGILFDWIYNNKNIYLIGNGENKLEFVHVLDFCEACILAMERANNEIFNIGGGGYSELRDDLEALIKHANRNSKLIPFNKMLATILLLKFDLLHLSPLTRFHYLRYSTNFYYDGYAKEELGYRPKYDNKKALIDSYDWYVSNIDKIKNLSGSIQRTLCRQKIFRILKDISF